jgi:hypothetical protein
LRKEEADMSQQAISVGKVNLVTSVFEQGCQSKVIDFPDRRKTHRINSLYGCITVDAKKRTLWTTIRAVMAVLFLWCRNVIQKAK